MADIYVPESEELRRQEEALTKAAARWISADPSKIVDTSVLLTATAILRDPPDSLDVPKSLVRRYESEVKRRHAWGELITFERAVAKAHETTTPDPTPPDPGSDDADFAPPDGTWKN